MAALSTSRTKEFLELLDGIFKHYAAHRPLIQRILNISFVLYVLGTTYKGFSARPAPKSQLKRNKDAGNEEEMRRPPRVAVDALFYQRLRHILRIVIPGIRSKEALMLIMHSSLLIARTAISLYVAALDGKIVASLVRAKPLEFAYNIIRWLLVAIPATWTNSWLSYIQSKLAIAYRTRLTDLVMREYLGGKNEAGPEGKVYYKISNLDDRIKNPDQMITHDIQRFSASLAAIYSNLAKPVLDVILYNYQLSQNVGAEGLVGLTILVQLSAALLRSLTPNFGSYTALSAQLAGALRHSHSRLAEFSEEIAFMRGEETEKMLIEREFATVILHERRVLRRRWWFGCVEEGIVKWLWGSFGLVLCAIPVFFKLPGADNIDLGGRTEGFVTNRRLLLSSSDAFGRVMYSYKDLSELAGYTARVSALLETMEDVKKGKFTKALVSSASTEENAKILQGRGEVFISEDIQFENVPIVTPNGDILVRSLSFKIQPGDITDDDLFKVLKVVQMENVVEREGGWDSIREWRDALSGGDKQKIAWARLFYHNPKYAILDEATSLVPLEMEGRMMEHATMLGITLLTVSHRPSLWKYHAMILHYDGQGGYVFTKLDAEKRLALQTEKQALEAKLADVPRMKARLAELKGF
ncbi:hypothetical protein HHX47_DHR1001920 [Lentinula edodes]|nr:hypothetical protein HHX47_DHR1001920 [Lentinula edodes]